MKTITVKDVMVPVSEYATVSMEANLRDAVRALEKAQKEFDRTRYRHRAVLVYEENRKIIGKVSQLDILRALEPKYEQVGFTGATGYYPFSRKFMKSLFLQYNLWEKPLDALCRKAGQKKVKELMHSPGEGEFVEENASLNEAVHQLVIGHHQSLLVLRGNEITGILRLTDVFQAVSGLVKSCKE